MARESFSQTLIAEGWKTPNTYSNHYSDAPDAPGIYIFAVYNILTQAVRVAYVGQSKRLARRWASHPIIRMIDRDISDQETIWRWFFPCDAGQLRAREARLIRQYDPPYNIAGRTRGFA